MEYKTLIEIGNVTVEDVKSAKVISDMVDCNIGDIVAIKDVNRNDTILSKFKYYNVVPKFMDIVSIVSTSPSVVSSDSIVITTDGEVSLTADRGGVLDVICSTEDYIDQSEVYVIDYDNVIYKCKLEKAKDDYEIVLGNNKSSPKKGAGRKSKRSPDRY